MSPKASNRIARLIRTLWHSRLHQLAARCRLTIDRRARVALRVTQQMPVPLPRVRQRRPAPILPPRDHLVLLREGTAYARLLGHEIALAPPVEWHAAETGDVTQLLKFHLHYLEYCEGLPDAHFIAVVDDWIANNPPFQPGYWRDSWSSYTLSLRCVVLMQQLARRWSRLAEDFRRRVSDSLIAQIEFLRRNLETDIGGNHLIKNIKALLWAGAFFEGPRADEWTAVGEKMLRAAMEEQILSDGMHFERSAAYHAQVFGDVLECYSVLPTNSVMAAKLIPTMASMASALRQLTHPDGFVSLFNDGGLRMSYLPFELLDAHARLVTVASEAPPSTTVLRDAGYYGIRTDRSFVLIDAGPIGPDYLPAHGHGDVLAFEWTVDGKRVIVDTGVFEYAVGPRRARSRSTAAHNTVTLDDQDQAEFWSSFRVGRRPHATVERCEVDAEELRLVGSHDGYAWMAGGPVHRRQFTVSSTRVAVEDQVVGGKGQQVTGRLLLHPTFTITESVESLLLTDGSITLRFSCSCPYTINASAAWFPDFGVEVPTLQLLLHYGAAPCASHFVLEVSDASDKGVDDTLVTAG
ncbi:MAG: hypothetical protein JWL61_621 [Gemmatimonadetes bacterium]|nr:hypothetical protein [Gemmatimonadota bacterium]